MIKHRKTEEQEPSPRLKGSCHAWILSVSDMWTFECLFGIWESGRLFYVINLSSAALLWSLVSSKGVFWSVLSDSAQAVMFCKQRKSYFPLPDLYTVYFLSCCNSQTSKVERAWRGGTPCFVPNGDGKVSGLSCFSATLTVDTLYEGEGVSLCS